MRNWAKLPLLLFLTVFTFCVSAEPVAWGNGAVWQTRSSEHFIIHFPQTLDSTAVKALSIAEKVHVQLLPFFAAAPNHKTIIVLVDDYDYSNGWATPFPFNQIRLYVNPPESVAGLEHTDEWLHGLILHEYVHTLHLNMGAGSVADLRRLFGRLPWLFPHQFTPSLFIEGLAVYLETDEQQGYGRLDGSYLPMQMRAELISHCGDGLNQAVVPVRDWPSAKPYLYGAYFWTFIAQEYGEEKIRQYLQAYSHQLIPYFFQNSLAKSVLGKGFDALWNDYLIWLNATIKIPTQPAQPSATALPTLANSQQVTASSPNGLWHVEANGQDRARLLLWQAQQNTAYSHTKNVTHMDVAEDGTLAVARLITYASGEAFNDVFLWHKAKGWQRLTYQQRFSQVRWLDNQTLLASRKVQGVSELWQINRHGDLKKHWQGAPGDVLGSFTVQPDASALVAAIKRPQRGWNLEHLDLHSGIWQPITQTKAREQQPEFLADGRLLFSADYNGVFNVYLLEAGASYNKGALKQLTQTATGAFKPQIVNNRLYFQEYTAEGFQLSQQPITVYAQHNLQDFAGQYAYRNYAPAADTTGKTTAPQPYSAWPSVTPKYWWPFILSDERSTLIGISTDGSDALGRHNYHFSYARDIENQLNEAELLYQYDNRWLAFARREHSFLTIEELAQPLTIQNDKLTLQRNHLFNAFEDQLQLQLGASMDHQRVVKLPVDVRLAERLAGAAFSFDNRQAYRQVPGIGWGSAAHIVYESANLIDNDFSGYRTQTGWQHWFDLPGRSTIKLGMQAGTSSKSMQPFVVGGSKIKDEHLLFNRQQFSLPGYPSYTQTGQHYYLAELRYNRWIARVERNLGLWPIGMGDISVSAWVKEASAWQSEEKAKGLTALGLEVRAELIVGYQMVLPVTLGLAQGLNDTLKETQGYIDLQFAF